MLANAAGIIEDARVELESAQPVIHKDLIEFKWISIAECTPAHNEKVIVRTNDGCMYFLSYPYDHKSTHGGGQCQQTPRMSHGN